MLGLNSISIHSNILIFTFLSTLLEWIMLSLSAENNFHKTILQYFFKCYTYKIKIYENNKSSNLYDLTLKTRENKTVILKDKKGNPSSYRLAITANLVAKQNDKVILKKNYVKSFDYQNNVNKFDQTRY